MESVNNTTNSQKTYEMQEDAQEMQNNGTKIIAKTENRAENLIGKQTDQFKNKVLGKIKDVANRGLEFAQNRVLPKVKGMANQGIEYAKDNILPKIKTTAQHVVAYTKDKVLPKVKEKAQPSINYMQNVALPNAKKKISSALNNIDINALKSYDKASILATLTIASKLCSLQIIKHIPIVNFIPALTTIFTAYTAVSPIIKIKNSKIDSANYKAPVHKTTSPIIDMSSNSEIEAANNKAKHTKSNDVIDID